VVQIRTHTQKVFDPKVKKCHRLRQVAEKKCSTPSKFSPAVSSFNENINVELFTKAVTDAFLMLKREIIRFFFIFHF
jgi:hypothetical protein